MSKEADELRRLLDQRMKGNVKAQIVRAVVTEVDWDNKTMTAKGLVDDLEYYDVLLGTGSFYRRPEIGTNCILAVLDGKEAATLLIDAGSFQEAVYSSADTSLTIKEEGFIIARAGEDLSTILSDMIDELNKIVVVYGNTINVAAMNAIKTRINNVLKSS